MAIFYILFLLIKLYGMRSKIYHKNIINTYSKYPEIFNPNFIVSEEISEEGLYDIIRESIHPRYPNIALKKWITLSKELSKYDNLLDELKKFSSSYEIENL